MIELIKKECEECQKQFCTHLPFKKFCSDICRRRYRHAHDNRTLEQKAELTKQWKLRNRDKVLLQHKRRNNKKKGIEVKVPSKQTKTSTRKYLDNNLKQTIHLAVSGKKYSKEFFSMLPFTVDELIKHIQNKFEPWMNWHNKGCYRIKGRTWIVSFINEPSINQYEFPTDEGFLLAWKLSNLAPVDSKKAIIKSCINELF